MFAGNTSSGYRCAFPLMCQTSARHSGSSRGFFQPPLPSLAPFPSPSIAPGDGKPHPQGEFVPVALRLQGKPWEVVKTTHPSLISFIPFLFFFLPS